MRRTADAHSFALVPFARGDELGDGCRVPSLPRVISTAGESASFHSVEFLTARIANPHTRAAYARAIVEFCGWCEARGLSLPALSSPLVAAYVHELGTRLSASSTNQHLSAIRQWLDWLTRSGVLRSNPAAAIRGARLSREEGKTPVLEREEARRLFASFERPDGLIHRRDRAILAAMLYDFVRVGALVHMRVRDFQEQDAAAWLVLREKAAKSGDCPPIISSANTCSHTSIAPV